VSWTTSRYLPKEERSVDYYENEYRFTAGDVVQVYTYKVDSGSISGDWKQQVTLAGAVSGVVAAVASTAAVTLALFSF